ncbi:hypothetical protein CLV98_101116 [Dyadobacter jejuensis]|uniref:Uncharacterized protein n=1 Tax=Dyadobacter jejuensis TaxID=1082580 RepID=A0A316AR85_9BACT|nr:hypothetical protein [Dyadobacter jejuensis]PWJ59941.1 hypothetical protein CLV98_101116 [Dyadobacter jejuensis]
MNIDQRLNRLKTIKKVEPPPFLWTRIQGRLQVDTHLAPRRWQWSFATVGLILLLVNGGALFSHYKAVRTPSAQAEIIHLVEGLQLSPTTTIYDE